MNENNFNLREQAYDKILKKILRIEYFPGQKISQKSIEDDLNLGRTPIREALLRLKQEGLIYTVPQSGTFVTKVDLNSVRNARFIRESIERKIVYEAANLKNNDEIDKANKNILLQENYSSSGEFNLFFDADEDFHKSFYIATDHKQVWDWLQNINIQFNRFRFLRLSVSDLPWETLIDQHKEILLAVEQRNPEKAEEAAVNHLALMEKEELSVLHKFPHFFYKLR